MKKVMYWATGISLGMTLLSGILLGVMPNGILLSLCITGATTGYHFGMRLLVGWMVDGFSDHINPDHGWFVVRNWEICCYRRLKVHRWKKWVPTYNPAQFDLKRVTLLQLARQMCVAELVHEVIILASAVPMVLVFCVEFLADSRGVFVVTSLIAMAIDSLFVLLQRYNRPRVLRLLERTR